VGDWERRLVGVKILLLKEIGIGMAILFGDFEGLSFWIGRNKGD
jgi:hypothetical protein